LKDRRQSAVILFFVLAILTILACLPYAPQGPFDARSFTRLAGMRVEPHGWTALIEPLFAPILVLGGAPNFLVAAVSLLLWVFLGAGAWGMFAALRSRKKKSGLRVALAGIQSSLIATFSLLLLIFLCVIARVPGWRLVTGDPNTIVADLHTHTVVSHDGLVSLRTNLDWHASCGYNMEVLIEHNNLVDHKTDGLSASMLARLPAFLSGIEVHTGPRAMAIGICRNTDVSIGSTGDTAAFVKKIHQGCGGAVIVVTLKNLKTSDIARLAADGVEGFEITHCGHPGLPEDLRRRVLAVSRTRGLDLVSDTDWHGWTGLTRTWTVIRAPGAAGLSRSARANVVLDKLRAHDTSDIIPVVAGYMGQPSRARAVFAPFVETVRYCMELSAARVISWWVWGWVVFVLWIAIEKKGFCPGDILPALLVWSTSVCLILAGISQVMQGKGTTGFGVHVGLITIGVGVIALGISTFRGVGFLRKPDLR
jgi:hypothetical protein